MNRATSRWLGGKRFRIERQALQLQSNEPRVDLSQFRAWIRRNWVAIVLVAVALLYGSAITLIHDDSLSPIDEVVYLDYTYKAFDQGLVREGEQFGDEVAQVVACEGVIPHGTFGQECGSSDTDLESMPNSGYTTGAPYTPVYFWITRIVGDPIHYVTGLSDVTSWRLTGSIWLAATVLMLSSLLRRWRIPSAATFALGLAFIASPYAWWTYTYLSTDVSAVLFGASILFVAGEAVRSRVSPWWLLPLAASAALFKITNLLVLGLVLLYLVVLSFSRSGQFNKWFSSTSADLAVSRKELRKTWFALCIGVVVGGVIQMVWTRLLPIMAVSDVRVDQGVNSHLSLSELIRLGVSGLAGPITHNPAAGIFHSAPFGSIAAPLGWLLIAGVVGAILVFEWDAERGPVIWATALATVLALPMLGIVFYLTAGSYFELPSRYASSLIPACLLVTGFMLKNRFATILVCVYAGILMVVGVALAAYVGAVY